MSSSSFHPSFYPPVILLLFISLFTCFAGESTASSRKRRSMGHVCHRRPLVCRVLDSTYSPPFISPIPTPTLPLPLAPLPSLHSPTLLSLSLASPLKHTLAIRHQDNSLDALYQIKNSPELLGALLLSIFSIAFLNFFGISVTKYLSATHRTTIDASRYVSSTFDFTLPPSLPPSSLPPFFKNTNRTVLVWIVSLIVKWEVFQWEQVCYF